MKQLYFLLFFIVGLSAIEYHGDRRQWTIVDADGKTNIALHLLNEPVDLIFPSGKTFAQIASDMKLYSPIGNVKCQDTTNTLGFALLFDDRNHIRCEITAIMVNGVYKVKMYLYEKCDGTEKSDAYATVIIENAEKPLENTARTCFLLADPFQQYGSDLTRSSMKLQVTPGNFGCQVFLVLPNYMHVKDVVLKEPTTLSLNATYAGENETFWWKTENDAMLQTAVKFVGKNVKIDILNSAKNDPYYFRVGTVQPIPALNFEFGPNCHGSTFDIYVNLRDSPECKSTIHLTQTGFKFSTNTSSTFISADPSPISLILVYSNQHVFVKVISGLSISAFPACAEDKWFAADQFVIQVEHVEKTVDCKKAEIWIHKSDFVKDIEVLVDKRRFISENATINSTMESNTTIYENSTVASSTKNDNETESAEFQWWWIVVPVLLIVVGVAVAVAVILIRRRRRNKIPIRKIRKVSKSAESEEVPASKLPMPKSVQNEKPIGPGSDSFKSKTPAPIPLPESKVDGQKTQLNDQALDDPAIKSKTKGSK
uniref:Uncharacterized protein n=1 Tax=Panagrolaimus davidi TaxID=227884 RepID=A0A914QHT0_9BILA